jgi:hypothetical protein
VSCSSNDAQRSPVRFHSLRDTCLTFMAIRGDDPLRIQWRAGHTSFAMTEKYIAQARRFEAGFGVPFGPLPPELHRSTNRSTEASVLTTNAGKTGATPTGIEGLADDANGGGVSPEDSRALVDATARSDTSSEPLSSTPAVPSAAPDPVGFVDLWDLLPS